MEIRYHNDDLLELFHQQKLNCLLQQVIGDNQRIQDIHNDLDLDHSSRILSNNN